jgi:hypothetical protein
MLRLESLGGRTEAGIGLIAMPTGILAAAFSDAFQKSRTQRQEFAEQTEYPRAATDAR